MFARISSLDKGRDNVIKLSIFDNHKNHTNSPYSSNHTFELGREKVRRR